MIRRVSSAGIGYSVVHPNDVTHVFACAVPHGGETFLEESRDALHTIEAAIRDEGALGTIVRQTVFLRDAHRREECRRIIEEFYGPDLPATSYIVQPPCEGHHVSIEAWGVGRSDDGVQIERCSDHLVIVRHQGIAWAHCAGIRPATPSVRVYDRSISAFERMADTLAARGFSRSQTVRTWLYLNDIVGPEGQKQRYEELNRARADFYENIHFLQDHVPPDFDGVVYPASTGIGTNDSDVLMECIALSAKRGDVVLLPLENPLQTSAFHYGANYGPESPRFSRAMAIVVGDCATILVSGTASIVGAQTQYVGDVEGQTEQTLGNIEALISEENFARHGMRGLGATLDGLALARVYVKRQDDYKKVRAICERRHHELPTIFAVADVCRPDLLVEVEGVALSKKYADAR